MSHGIKSTGLRSSLVGNDSYYVPPLPKPPNLPPPPSNKHNIPAPSGAPPPVGAQSRPHSSRFGDHYPLKPPGYSASGDYTDLAVSLEKANNDRNGTCSIKRSFRKKSLKQKNRRGLPPPQQQLILLQQEEEDQLTT